MKKQIPSMTVLIVVCVVAVVALGLVHGSTAQQAAQQEAALLTAARNSVLEADHFEKRELQESKYALNELYAGLNASGETVGFVGSTTVSGFGGPIEVTAGVDNEGVITGIAVGGDQFNETEGLGALTRQPAFTEQFKGKKPTITLNEGGVDTVTAASTTSRAVVSGVNTVAKYIYGAELGIAEEESGPYAGQTISASDKGFGGDVTVTVGMTEDGVIEYLAIDAPNETDGLGKLASEKEFTSQFIGKKAPFAFGDGIDQVAGATFTSNAVINALNTIAEGGGEKSAEPITTTVKGFGGDVTLTVKLNPDNSIAALAIDTPNETDGLGKLASESEFTSQFIGKTAPFAFGDGIDQVTGASVTSNAVLDGLNSVVPAADGSVAPAATPEPAPEATAAPVAIGALNDGTYSVDKDTDFSTIHVEMTVEGGKVASAKVTSEVKEGSMDMLTDDSRAAFANQIVEKQAVDAVSSVTISSNAIAEAVTELLAQASGK